MPVPGVQTGQMWYTQSTWSVDVCQTMGVCEQWLYANAEDSDQDLLLKRVSPSFTYKGVFTLLSTNTIIFIY